MTATRSVRLTRYLQRAMCLFHTGLFVIVVILWAAGFPLHLPRQSTVFSDLDHGLFLLVLGILALSTLYIPPNVGMSLSILSVSSVLGLILSPVPIQVTNAAAAPIPTSGEIPSPPTGGQFVLGPAKTINFVPNKVSTGEDEWYEDSRHADERLILRPVPGIKARQHHRDFDVFYTHDQTGWRIMPEPKPIIFLGCSFTYGMGVGDTQTFPYLLADKAWPTFRVVNISQSGAGTNDSLRCLEEIKAYGTRPKLVLYCYISLHLRRNYKRQSWHGRNPEMPFAYYEVENDDLVDKGNLLRKHCNLPDSPETDAQEERVTYYLLKRMKSLCEQMNAAFVIINLCEADHFGYVAEMSKKLSIPMIDLSKMSIDTYPNDYHPRPPWHQGAARRIASSKLLSELTGEPSLYKPDAIPKPGPTWHLQVWTQTGAKAVMKYKDDGSVTVLQQKGSDGEELPLTLKMGPIPINKGSKYRCRFRISASTRTSVSPFIGSLFGPYVQADADKPIAVTENGLDYDHTFTASADISDGAFMLLFGKTKSDLSVTLPKIHHNGVDLVQQIYDTPTTNP